MTLKFLGNVDPVAFHRATDGLDLEETMFIIISKTFTTAETMLNATTIRDALFKQYDCTPGCVTCFARHMCAVTANVEAAAEFGIGSID